MAKKVMKTTPPGFVSLRLINNPDGRTPLEGVPGWKFAVGDSVILQDGKKLLSTGIILEILPDNKLRTREGIYEIHYDRAD